MLQSLSETVIVPIAAAILALVMCYEPVSYTHLMMCLRYVSYGGMATSRLR